MLHAPQVQPIMPAWHIDYMPMSVERALSTETPEGPGRRALLLDCDFDEALALCRLGSLVVEYIAVFIRTQLRAFGGDQVIHSHLHKACIRCVTWRSSKLALLGYALCSHDWLIRTRTLIIT